MRRSIVPVFAGLMFQISAMAFDASPAVYSGTDWGQAASIAVTGGTDRVPYVDQGELDMPAGFAFGYSVATWNDGAATVLVVGSPDEDDNNGAAYIFRRSGKTGPWRQEARLAVAGSDGDFGVSVAVSADVVVVGAPGYSNGSSTGTAFTYVRDTATGQWNFESSLSIAGASEFGERLAFDGAWLFVCDPRSNFVEGYRRDGSSWKNVATLTPPDSPRSPEFGSAVALDHDHVLIGAPDDATVANGSGSAYLFDYDAPTGSWLFERKLSNSISGENYLAFGTAVALVGNSAVVAASNQGDGRVLSFRHFPSMAIWSQQSGELQSTPYDFFGQSLAYNGSLLAIGANNRDGGKGAVYLYSGMATSWTAIAELDSNAEGNASLGTAVAIADSEVFGGGYSALWAGIGHGSVDVFESPSGTWGKTQSIHAAGDSSELFGSALAISGNTVVATAPNNDAVIVYSRDEAGHWQAEATLPADYFEGSHSVALDGDTLIIGTPFESFGSHDRQGAAYVYIRQRTPTGVAWIQQAFLADPSGLERDAMGAMVSLSGNTALIGAPGRNGYAGGAYVFIRSGTSWTQQAQLTVAEKVATNAEVGAFGAIDKDTAILGAWNADGAYVFQRTGTTWVEKKKISGSGTVLDDGFGHAIALSNSNAFISSPLESVGTHTEQGRVYVFDTHDWTQKAAIDSPDTGANFNFGSSLAAEANRLIVGAPSNSNAYAYSRQKGAWTLQSKFADDEASALGTSVSVSGGQVTLGAPIAGPHDGGRIYVFQDDRIFEDELE